MTYVEDELKRRPKRLLMCGFGAIGEAMAPELESELNVSVEPLRSRFGVPGPYNAGLYGYLESVEAG